ncbi:hypothetical protein C8R26_1154 [Nitrosomonas oligotropha]|uniref:Uncharacterized protein n=1 Tax=Nitrosomonas oligotropha TaxID=42354 RepID=A0A2T5HYE1_9PROT|nr:YfiR family protein [Nitrosomonas oligotropha]PTQ76605.1 hypothetical protein C8R26_1154 [Nitrosomonas oligotropha]
MAASRSASKPTPSPLIDKFSRKILLQSIARLLLAFLLGNDLPMLQRTALAQPTLEYQVKAAFIYNFIAFTQWPDVPAQ